MNTALVQAMLTPRPPRIAGARAPSDLLAQRRLTRAVTDALKRERALHHDAD